MNSDRAFNVIPNDAHRCVWMDAGVVSYKLCDKGFECDGCSFDVEVRKHQERSTAPLHVTVEPPQPPPAHPDGVESAHTFLRSAVRRQIGDLLKRETPADRLYHRNHFWIRQQEDDIFRLGIDHVAAALVRPVLGVVRPQAPGPVHLHEPCCWIVVSSGTITIPSPVDGSLMSFNPLLADRPSVVDADPYQDGWIMELTVRPRSRGMQSFVRSSDRPALLKAQSAVLEIAFAEAFHHHRPAIGATLYDGGAGIPDLPSILGPKSYHDVISRIFRLPL